MVTGTQLLLSRKRPGWGFHREVLKRLTQHNGTWQGHSVVLQAEAG